MSIVDTLLETFFNSQVTQDDALQRGVPAIGEGDPVSEERRRKEIFGDLGLRHFKTNRVQCYIGDGCVGNYPGPDIITDRQQTELAFVVGDGLRR